MCYQVGVLELDIVNSRFAFGCPLELKAIGENMIKCGTQNFLDVLWNSTFYSSKNMIWPFNCTKKYVVLANTQTHSLLQFGTLCVAYSSCFIRRGAFFLDIMLCTSSAWNDGSPLSSDGRIWCLHGKFSLRSAHFPVPDKDNGLESQLC